MANSNNSPWLTKSWAYLKASGLVKTTLASPEKLFSLAAKASMVAANNLSALSEVADSLQTALRLVRRYATGEYRDISLQSMGLIVASTIYLVMPIDALPDFIVGLGLTDDAAILLWTLRAVNDDLTRFRKWEKHEPPN